MKQVAITLLLLALLATIAGLIMYAFGVRPNMLMDGAPKSSEIVNQCNSYKGNWVTEYNECEYTSEYWCDKMGGTFDECESACRHSEDPRTICTMQCVPVCRF